MKKFVAAVLLAAAAVTAFGCGQSSAATGSDGGQTAFRRVTGDEAQKMMESETGYLIVDVRTPQEYAEGHIPHAINVPLDTIGTNPRRAPRQSADDFRLLPQRRAQHDRVE